MTREQVGSDVGQQDGGAAATPTEDATFGLRPDLYAQVMQLTPGDAEALSLMLKTYQRFNGAILQVAARHMGNAAVQRAIAIVTNARSKIRPGELSEKGATGVQPSPRMSHADMQEFLEDPSDKAQPAKGPLSHAEMREFLEDPSGKAQPAAAAAAPRSAHATAEPAWVDGARAYNAAHPDLVDEFNRLTNDVARLDGEGEVDPQAVAHWQRNHHLAADGKIGPHTIEAAKQPRAHGPQAEEAAATGTPSTTPVR